MKEREIFVEAIQLDDATAREAFLRQACGGDAALRRSIEELLADQENDESCILDQPIGSLPSGSRHTLPIATQIGPYKLREKIGEGGMGVVYLAEQTRPVKRKVALKVIKWEMASPSVVTRFEAERQALALMDHPNIARVFDGGTTEAGQPYFVMELVQGLSMTEYCNEQRLNTDQRLTLFLSVCRAVYHAHQKGIIHRDLKPSNVLVPEIDGEAVPKVIDFGVAKAIDQRLTDQTVYTQFSQLVGTPLYMSPEQAELGVVDVDTRSDVYALGVLLYELLTGSTPFDSNRLKRAAFDEMRRIIREQEPRRPSVMLSTLQAAALSTVTQQRSSSPRQLRDMLHGELDWIVMKALEKDRGRRYQSASALAADIERLLANQPVSARPPSSTYRFGKFVQRNKARLIPAAVTASILLVGLTVAVFAFLRERAANIAQSIERARQVYVHEMKEGVTAWEDRDFGVLDEKVADAVPRGNSPDFRGWEWHYLNNQSRKPFANLPPGRVERAAWRPETQNQIAVSILRSPDGHAVELWEPENNTSLRKLLFIDGTGPSAITVMQWSADGSRLAIGTASGRAIVHDVAAGKTIFDRQLYERSADPSNLQAMDISSTGKLLISANFLGQIRIWDVDENRLMAEPLDPLRFEPLEPQNVSCIAISPDDRQFVASTRFGTIRMWRQTDRHDGPAKFQEVTREDTDAAIFGEFGQGSQGRLAWRADGTHFAATDVSIVAVYPGWPKSGVPKVEATSKFAHLRADSVCWIGNVLVTGGADHTVRWWDVEREVEIRSMQIGRGPVEVLGASDNGKYLALRTTDDFRILRVNHPVGHQIIHPPVDRPNAGMAITVRWSHDGRYIATGQSNSPQYNNWGTLYVYDSQSGDTVLERPIGVWPRIDWAQDDRWLQVAISHQWGFLYTVGVTDPSVTLVRDVLHQGVGFIEPAVNRMLGLVAFPNEPASRSGKANELRICDLETLNVVDRIDIGGGGRVFWSPNGQKLAHIRPWSDSPVLIYDARSRRHHIKPIDNVYLLSTPLCAWNPDSTELVLGTFEGLIHIIDVETLEVRQTLSGHDAPVNGLAWSPDGSRIASCAGDGTLRLWDSLSGDEMAIFRLPPRDVGAVDWSRDGRKLAVGVRTGDVYVLDAGELMPAVKVTKHSEKDNPFELLAEIAERTATAQQVLVDDFDDGDDVGWTRHDGTAGKPGGPVSFDVTSCAYQLSTTNKVHTELPYANYGMATWDQSSDPNFSNGFVRAKVRIDTAGCVASVGFRINEDETGGYLFRGGMNWFAFNRVEKSRPTKKVMLGLGLKMGLGEEWWIEAGGVGDQLSMKVWRVGESEPALPQLTIIDSTFARGRLGVKIGWPHYPDAAQVDATFDDITFKPLSEDKVVVP